MDFYGTVAQVIPVLLLAIIFQNRLLLRQPSSYDPSQPNNASSWNATQIVGRIYVTLLIAAAEMAALIGLYRQETNRLTDGVVWLGVAAALTLLVWSVVVHQSRYWREWWSTDAKGDWWLSAFSLAGLLVLTFGFLSTIP